MWGVLKLIVSRLFSFKILLGLSMLVIALRTPGGQLVDLARVLFVTAEKGSQLSTLGYVVASTGWVLAIVFLITFIYMSRRADRIYKRELDRVTAERNKLQEHLTNQTVAHSKRRPN